jgi:U3 small nucleolar RNA-associated protein 3
MLKDALSTLEELDFDASEGEEDEDEEELDSEFSELDMDSDELDAMTEEEFVELQKKLMSKKKGRSKLELDDLEALLRDAERDLPDSDVDSDLSAEDVPLPPPKKQKKRKETSADEPAK